MGRWKGDVRVNEGGWLVGCEVLEGRSWKAAGSARLRRLVAIGEGRCAAVVKRLGN